MILSDDLLFNYSGISLPGRRLLCRLMVDRNQNITEADVNAALSEIAYYNSFIHQKMDDEWCPDPIFRVVCQCYSVSPKVLRFKASLIMQQVEWLEDVAENEAFQEKISKICQELQY